MKILMASFAVFMLSATAFAAEQGDELLPVQGMEIVEEMPKLPVPPVSQKIDGSTDDQKPQEPAVDAAKTPAGPNAPQKPKIDTTLGKIDEETTVTLEKKRFYRTKFHLEEAEQIDINDAKARAASMRVGLVFQKPNGVFVPLQRGTLHACEKGACTADFEDNEMLRKYRRGFKWDTNIYITFLQLPNLKERLMEIARGKEKSSSTHTIFIDLAFGNRNYDIKETSSSAFNASKFSRRPHNGYAFSGGAQFDSVFLRYDYAKTTLTTAQFFGAIGNTYSKESFVSAGFDTRLFNWIPYTHFRYYAGLYSNDFLTANQDEAILTTTMSAKMIGASMRVDLPWFFNGTRDSNFRVGIGGLDIGFDYAISGDAKDQGGFVRGTKADTSLNRFRISYEFLTYARKNKLLDNIGIAFGYFRNAYQVQFSGDPAAPNGVSGITPNTTGKGVEKGWIIQLVKHAAF